MIAEITYDLPAIIDKILGGIICIIIVYGVFIKN